MTNNTKKRYSEREEAIISLLRSRSSVRTDEVAEQLYGPEEEWPLYARIIAAGVLRNIAKKAKYYSEDFEVVITGRGGRAGIDASIVDKEGV
jgi:hypothetical protein